MIIKTWHHRLLLLISIAFLHALYMGLTPVQQEQLQEIRIQEKPFRPPVSPFHALPFTTINSPK